MQDIPKMHVFRGKTSPNKELRGDGALSKQELKEASEILDKLLGEKKEPCPPDGESFVASREPVIKDFSGIDRKSINVHKLNFRTASRAMPIEYAAIVFERLVEGARKEGKKAIIIKRRSVKVGDKAYEKGWPWFLPQHQLLVACEE